MVPGRRTAEMSQQHTTDEGETFIDDVTDAEARELAHRERGTVRPITVVGNPVLHRECQDVTEFGDELAALVDDMFATPARRRGRGPGRQPDRRRPEGLRLRLPRRRRTSGTSASSATRCSRTCRRTGALDDSNEGCLSVPGAVHGAGRAPTTPWSAARTPTATPIVVGGTGLLRPLPAARDRPPLRAALHRPALQARPQGRHAPDGGGHPEVRDRPQRLSRRPGRSAAPLRSPRPGPPCPRPRPGRPTAGARRSSSAPGRPATP